MSEHSPLIIQRRTIYCNIYKISTPVIFDIFSKGSFLAIGIGACAKKHDYMVHRGV